MNLHRLLSQAFEELSTQLRCAEERVDGSASPISPDACVGFCAPRLRKFNACAPVLGASLASGVCAPQLSPTVLIATQRFGYAWIMPGPK